ncbi:glycosyltransferase [candidate division KSB1 bacterium]|nr:glycosyltransferase [candidate division KSB1 bacterium]
MIKKHKIGIAVAPERPLELAEAVNFLLASDSLRKEMGDRGRELVQREYDWEVITHRIVGFLKSTER